MGLSVGKDPDQPLSCRAAAPELEPGGPVTDSSARARLPHQTNSLTQTTWRVRLATQSAAVPGLLSRQPEQKQVFRGPPGTYQEGNR